MWPARTAAWIAGMLRLVKTWRTRAKIPHNKFLVRVAASGKAQERREFIARFRLEKKDPAAALSEPVKPITFYFDPAIPAPIRTAMKQGTLWWNKAFEQAGFEVVDQGAQLRGRGQGGAHRRHCRARGPPQNVGCHSRPCCRTVAVRCCRQGGVHARS